MYKIKFCSNCGSKVEEDSKYCGKCGNLLYSVSFNIQGTTNEYEFVDTEIEAADTIIDNLGIDKSLFKYVKPSNDYTTIQYKDYDFVRLKYTNNAKWIKIPMSTEMKKKYKDNSLFDAEENKNKVMWKSNIKDLHDYKNILLEVIEFRNK